MARIVTGSANARDLLALCQGLCPLPQIKACLGKLTEGKLQRLAGAIDELRDCHSLIRKSIVDDPPFTVREGGIIRPGCR